MATLICIAVYSTKENGRSEYTRRTLYGLLNTVDFKKHRLIVSDNGSCLQTHATYEQFRTTFDREFPSDHFKLILNGKNLGTAAAVNLGIKERKKEEFVIKQDDDVIVHANDWVDQMEEAITRHPSIGILGLKRNDLIQSPTNPSIDFRSELVMLPHESGQRWIIIEKTKDIIGTCTMYNPALLDRIGYLYQPTVYGHDDVIASYRSNLAGFINAFLTHVPISHIDSGKDKNGNETEFIKWKKEEAGRNGKEFEETIKDLIKGYKPIYYDGGFSEKS